MLPPKFVLLEASASLAYWLIQHWVRFTVLQHHFRARNVLIDVIEFLRAHYVYTRAMSWLVRVHDTKCLVLCSVMRFAAHNGSQTL